MFDFVSMATTFNIKKYIPSQSVSICTFNEMVHIQFI